MNSRLLKFYNQELSFIRKMGAEFARNYPNIASGLDLGKSKCTDPYVERLLEGFAFLTARIQLKLDAQFPRFTHHLLEMVYPHYLAPTPAMCIVQFEPDEDGSLTEQPFPLPKDTRLLSRFTPKGRAKSEFRTAHALKVWPLSLTQVDYLPAGKATGYARPHQRGIQAGLRFRLKTTSDIPFRKLALNTLPLYLQASGADRVPMQVYELMLAHCLAVVVQPCIDAEPWQASLPADCIQALGFEDKQALLPYGPQSFQGYRLLQEYFALPERFLFVAFKGLQAVLQRCDETVTELEIVVLLDTVQNELEDLLSKDNFALNCTPAINLFPKRADYIHIDHRSHEYHLVVDRTRPRDYEVHTITQVTGYGSDTHLKQSFRAFYSLDKDLAQNTDSRYYTAQRSATLEPTEYETQKQHRVPYQGTELYLSLVDTRAAPYRSDLKQLGVETLCTNRDLPQLMLSGEHNSGDFTLEISAPAVKSVRCLIGPTEPKPAYLDGEQVWRLISHLSLNYLTLLDDNQPTTTATDEDDHHASGAQALRELLVLYSDPLNTSARTQIAGLRAISSKPMIHRIASAGGRMAFGNGVEITLTLEEQAFEGSSALLFSAVLERFFSQYVSINSFTQTVVKTPTREIIRWPVRTGTRTIL